MTSDLEVARNCPSKKNFEMNQGWSLRKGSFSAKTHNRVFGKTNQRARELAFIYAIGLWWWRLFYAIFARSGSLLVLSKLRVFSVIVYKFKTLHGFFSLQCLCFHFNAFGGKSLEFNIIESYVV